MSGLAKFFVVLNLVLALFFLGVSATLFNTQENWKSAAEKSQAQNISILEKQTQKNQTYEGKISTLENDKNSLTSENRLFEQKISGLERENGDHRGDIAEQKTRNDDLDARIAQKDKHLEDKDTVIGRMEEEVQTLNSSYNTALEAKKNAERLRNRSLLDKEQLSQQLVDANKELAALREDYDNQQLLLTRIVDSGVRLPDIGVQVAPAIDGVVVAVEEGIVILSVGKDDGVEEGYEFTVYDGDVFLGKIQVTRVLDDMAGCKILFVENGMNISSGNKASTRLAG